MKKKVLTIALLVAVLALLIAFGKGEEHRLTLEAKMDGIWEKTVENGVVLQLDIEEGRMTYRLVSLDFPELSDTLAEYRWRAQNHESIRVSIDGGKTRTLTVTVRERVLVFSPALTDQSSLESWTRVK
jgi:hypothetical protein